MKYYKKVGIIGIRGLPAMYGAFDRFVEQFVGSKIIKQKDVVFYVGCDFAFKKFKGFAFIITFYWCVNFIMFYEQKIRSASL